MKPRLPGGHRPARDVDEETIALLVGELNHRIRNHLAMVEAAIRRTQSTSVEDYRDKLMARIVGLRRFYELTGREGYATQLAELLEHTMRPYCSKGARLRVAGPDLQLEPKLALALHLVIHELAANAKKYGALKSTRGRVSIDWRIRYGPGDTRALALVWAEQRGPVVTPPRHRGFGLRLMARALTGYGEVRLDFKTAGLACFMLLDLPKEGTMRPDRTGSFAASTSPLDLAKSLVPFAIE